MAGVRGHVIEPYARDFDTQERMSGNVYFVDNMLVKKSVWISGFFLAFEPFSGKKELNAYFLGNIVVRKEFG